MSSKFALSIKYFITFHSFPFDNDSAIIRNSSDSKPQTAFFEGYSLLRSSCLWLNGVQPINGNEKTALSK